MKQIITILAFLFLFLETNANAQLEEDTIHFGIISDIQYSDRDDAGRRVYRAAPEKLRQAIDTLNNQEIDFCLNLGDVIDKYWESYDTIIPILKSGNFKTYNLLGNHDFEELTVEQWDSLIHILEMPSRYYTFKKGNWRFVMLDANEISLYANEAGSEQYVLADSILNVMKLNNEINANIWNGGMSNKQFLWLDSLLSKSDTLGEYVMVCAHHNIYPLNMNSMLFYERTAQVLEAHNSVKAFLSGHWHDGGHINNGLHYYNIKALLDYTDSTAFAVVNATQTKLDINGFGREPDRILAFNSYYNLNVVGAEGSGLKQQGDTIIVHPDENIEREISYWKGDVFFIDPDTSETIRFMMPAYNTTVEAVFQYNFTATVMTPGGSTSVDKSSADYGETVTFTVTPELGYSIDSVIYNGNNVTGEVIDSVYRVVTKEPGFLYAYFNEDIHTNQISHKNEILQIFPNPTSSQISISWRNNYESGLLFKVYDMKGKLIHIEV